MTSTDDRFIQALNVLQRICNENRGDSILTPLGTAVSYLTMAEEAISSKEIELANIYIAIAKCYLGEWSN